MSRMMKDEVPDGETYVVIGAAFEVPNQLGPGFLEAVYHEALVVKLNNRSVPDRREVALPVYYKGNKLACSYRADLLCYDGLLVEVKAVEKLCGKEQAQVINYLKACHLDRALLLNFGTRVLEYKRLYRPPVSSASSSSSSSVKAVPGRQAT